MGGQQKDFISDIVFFQHQDGMRLNVRRHFLLCLLEIDIQGADDKLGQTQ